MANHNITGKAGEDKAVEYLLERGHVLLARNYRYRRDEVDIITRDGNCIVFTEVKTRSSNTFGLPEEFVDKAKRKAMKRVAEQYLSTFQKDTDVRFDVVSVLYVSGGTQIHHIKDAFFNEESDVYN